MYTVKGFTGNKTTATIGDIAELTTARDFAGNLIFHGAHERIEIRHKGNVIFYAVVSVK